MSQPLAAAATPLEQIEHDLQPRLQRDLIEATLLEAQVGATLSFEYRFVDVTEVRAPTPWQPFSNTIRALVVADDADGDDAPTKWLRLNGESIRYFPIESTDPVCVTQYRNLVLQHVLRAPAALSPKGRTKRPAAKRAREEDDAPPPPPPLAAPVANTISLSNEQLRILLQTVNSQRPLAQHEEEEPALLLDGFFDQVNGMKTVMHTLVDGLRIPKGIESSHTWLYPHLFLGASARYRTVLREKFSEFGCSFRNINFKEDVDLDIDSLTEHLSSAVPRLTKESWRIPFFLINRIASAVLHTSTMGSASIAESFTQQFRKNFAEGRLDLGVLWTTHTNKQATMPSQQPTVVGAITPSAVAANTPKARENTQPAFDYVRLQGMIDQSIAKAANSQQQQNRRGGGHPRRR